MGNVYYIPVKTDGTEDQHMSVIPKIECRRCGREYSGLRSRCPYCGTTRVRAGDKVPPITSSENAGTAAAQRAEINTRWQTIFGLLLLACVVLAVVVLITISLADAKEINSSTAQNLPSQDMLPQETDEPMETDTAQPAESSEPTATPSPADTTDTQNEVGSIKMLYYGSERTEFSEAVGETVPLTAETYPADRAGEVVWASENEAVCIVRDGQVTGIGPGMTTITASIGDVVAKCTVYVG